MSNMIVSLIWPLESGPLPFSEAQELYDSITSSGDPKFLSRFFGDYMYSEPELMKRLGLAAFGTIHYYPNIEEDGKFPDGPEDWITPTQLRAAAERMRRLIDSSEPDGGTLREAYLDCQQKRFASQGPSAEVCLAQFREDLDWLIQASTTCEQRGIDRVAVCFFD
jgi:hypothetical protein